MKQDCLGCGSPSISGWRPILGWPNCMPRGEAQSRVQWLDALERLWKDGDADLAPMQRLGRLQKLVAQQGFTGGGHFK